MVPEGGQGGGAWGRGDYWHVGNAERKREEGFTSLFLRQKEGWGFFFNQRFQKSLKFCFKGINIKNLKSRRKGIGFLNQQNDSVGLK